MYKKLSVTNILFWIILGIAVITRTFYLGSIPNDISQDEALAGYEAWAMSRYGIDSWGYKNPVYFISWGSGMNVFYSYLLRIFFYFLDAEIWVLRLPQAILGILSCYIFYRALKICYGKNIALIGFFIITIIPWHITQSRWGLESSACTFGMLAGFYFYLKALKKIKYLYLSVLFYATALYSYAVTWIPTFFIILFYAVYLFFINKQNRLHILGALSLLAFLAFPILLLILVNYGYIDEIKGNYISIPKLAYWRDYEWGYNNLAVKLDTLYYVFIKPVKIYLPYYITKFGLFYPFSLFFIALGCINLLKRLYTELKNKKISYSLPMVIWLIVGIIYGIGLYPLSTRFNFLYFSLVWLIVLGICLFNKKIMLVPIIILYFCSFVYFSFDYYNNYNKFIEEDFSVGFDNALVYANKKRQSQKYNIVITEGYYIYSKILWHQKIPVNDFIDTIVWRSFPKAYLGSSSFLHYRFTHKIDIKKIANDCIYITKKINKNFFSNFEITEFGRYIVAIPKQ